MEVLFSRVEAPVKAASAPRAKEVFTEASIGPSKPDQKGNPTKNNILRPKLSPTLAVFNSAYFIGRPSALSLAKGITTRASKPIIAMA